jgi:succinoglycan biosynthesis transport protein ExoP
MPSEHPLTPGQVSTSRAVRHHLALVTVCLVLGAFAGWLYAASSPTTYTSTARVLVNPSVGNPFVPSPTAVRQDELTSLETEAQVARSAEVLDTVPDLNPPLTTSALERGLLVTVPPNTQLLEISYSASDPTVAQQVAGAVADAYLVNRDRRFEAVQTERIDQLQTQTDTVVTDLRTATAAAQTGSAANRSFQAQLATALRNDLVNLRAQRSALETSESPAGAVITPATAAQSATDLVAVVAPFGGALVGLAVGCLVAVLLERARGVVRSAREVEETGVPVAAAVSAPGWRDRLHRRHDEAFDSTIRRLRASILELDPRPDVVAVAPAGAGESNAEVSEAVAETFARAGHRVVLVRTDGPATTSDLVVEEGLAQALLYERMNVMELLQPTVEPLLGVLPGGGFTAQSREFFVVDRLRAVLAPLIEAGNLVVIQSPGIDSAEGEAVMGAAALGLVVVTTGRTRTSAVEQVVGRVGTAGAPLAALVVGHRDAARRPRLVADDIDPDPRHVGKDTHSRLFRTRR